MACVLLKLSMSCIGTYVDYMYGGLWSYMLMLTCIMSLILVKERFYQIDMKALLPWKCPFWHVFAWSPYLVLNCANPFLSLFGLKCRDLEKMTCHGFDRFLSVEDEDLVSPHRFEDNTQYVLLCLLVLFKLCTGLVPKFVL